MARARGRAASAHTVDAAPSGPSKRTKVVQSMRKGRTPAMPPDRGDEGPQLQGEDRYRQEAIHSEIERYVPSPIREVPPRA